MRTTTMMRTLAVLARLTLAGPSMCTLAALAILTLAGLAMATTVAAGLDCARVRELNQSGTRASEIARTLGITTPDVQACLAGEVEEPVANQAGRLPLAPQVPAGDGLIRRGPDGQED